MKYYIQEFYVLNKQALRDFRLFRIYKNIAKRIVRIFVFM